MRPWSVSKMLTAVCPRLVVPLARQLAVMDREPDVGLTFSHSMYLTQEGEPTGQLLLSRCAQPTVRDLIARNHVGNGSTPVVRRA